ncbi:MAG: hypothetical protein K940chlam3_00239 [Chlamydiae bacterium]|nr:hypothetical protein [Chlamydiota bacterium]
MEPQALLDHYINAVQELLGNSEDSHAIGQLIDAYHAKYADNPDYQQLLEGERSFWEKDYETALKKYLEAKNVPAFQFFCFRASAFISKKLGQHDQAMCYAQKALTFYPKDPSTIYIFNQLSDAPSNDATDELHHIFKDHEPTNTLFQEEKPCDPIPVLGAPTNQEKQPSLISQKLQEFQKSHESAIKHYREHLELRTSPKENFLTILNGWGKMEGSSFSDPITTNCLKETRTGIFIRWKNRGIVINPGRHFLDAFHQAGYVIEDIDFIIVTQCCPESYHDVMAIHQLNEQLNEISPNRHTIHYYLNQKVHQEISPFLQPQYKQERFKLHSLEIFLDSPDRETAPLDEEISLHYFSTCSSTKEDSKKCTLGIVLDFPGHKIGYVSGCAWSPMLPIHLKDCQILCVGIGTTNNEDYERSKYLSDCLGYNGVYSLLEQLSPQVLLCTEFSGHLGDLRLEFVQQIREDKNNINVFPADHGFYLDLKQNCIRSSVDNELLDPQQVKVARVQGPYSKLQYLSEESVL